MRIGLAFQVRDDLLSLQASESIVGKTLSTDTDKLKSTYPRALGIAGAEAYLARLTEENLGAIGKLGLREPGVLMEIARAAAERDR